MKTKHISIFVPKIVGEDEELGGAVIGTGSEASFALAARLVLQEVSGFPKPRLPVLRPLSGDDETDENNPYERDRNFLGNGGCLYQDCLHVEMCAAEQRSAKNLVAGHHAMLVRVRDAAAQASSQSGRRIEMVARNSDGFGNSYGAHLDLLVTRAAFDDVTGRLLPMSWFASAQVSMPIFAGQGKVGAENGASPCRYQLSQRADFFESLVGYQTTERRPLVNTRDEAHAKPGLARLHIIYPDVNLCHYAHWLKVGVYQLLGAMLEGEAWDSATILADPVAAAVAWSHDPDFQTTVPTLAGRDLTALEHQRLLCEAATHFVATRLDEGIVPDAPEIVAQWAETLTRLEARDTAWLSRRLDWVLKRELIESAMAEDPQLSWDSPEVRVLDHRYGLLDDGLYFACEQAGLVERLVSPAEIERFVHQPPTDTRAFTRGKLLQFAEEDHSLTVESLHWDHIIFRSPQGTRYRVCLDDPQALGAGDSPMAGAETLSAALKALHAAGLVERLKDSRHRFQFQQTDTP